jgi:hypothetical protein
MFFSLLSCFVVQQDLPFPSCVAYAICLRNFRTTVPSVGDTATHGGAVEGIRENTDHYSEDNGVIKT